MKKVCINCGAELKGAPSAVARKRFCILCKNEWGKYKKEKIYSKCKKYHLVPSLGYFARFKRDSEGNPKTILMHREIIETKIGRKLKSTEQVHHIDGNPLNNKKSNLLLCGSLSEHNQVGASAVRFLGKLIRRGEVKFDKKTKSYTTKKCLKI